MKQPLSAFGVLAVIAIIVLPALAVLGLQVFKAAPNKKCEILSDSEGEEYIYGEAELVHFVEAYPPAGADIKRDSPRDYAASFRFPNSEVLKAYISGEWEDTTLPDFRWKLVPLSTAMISGKSYSFCYKLRGSVNNKYLSIALPETIEIIDK